MSEDDEGYEQEDEDMISIDKAIEVIYFKFVCFYLRESLRDWK